MKSEMQNEARWRGEAIPKVILGTVQLGMPYGIANTSGKPDYAQARALVEAAWEGGIRHFDTAQAYGESEAVLGRILQEMGVRDQARITSKLDAALDPHDSAAVRSSVEASCRRLGEGPLWAMLFHRPDWLDAWDSGLGALLLGLREEGVVHHLGASLHHPTQTERVLAHPAMEVIQIAANAWDRRITDQDFFAHCKAADRFACVRSIYLQGLLTMRPEAVAARLPLARALSEGWVALAQDFGMSPKALAVAYAASLGAPLLLGAENAAQVRETLALLRDASYSEAMEARIRAELTPYTQEAILDPGQWPAKETPEKDSP